MKNELTEKLLKRGRLQNRVHSELISLRFDTRPDSVNRRRRIAVLERHSRRLLAIK